MPDSLNHLILMIIQEEHAEQEHICVHHKEYYNSLMTNDRILHNDCMELLKVVLDLGKVS